MTRYSALRLSKILVFLTALLGSRASFADVTASLTQASDWSTTAPKVGPFVAGNYEILVWGPPKVGWGIHPEGQNLAFLPQDPSAEGVPAWRTAGELSLSDKQILTLNRGPENKQESSQNSGTGTDEPGNRRVPALVWIRLKGTSSQDVLDVVRGRLDVEEPTADSRREVIRTNQEGVDFTAPPSADDWKERTESLRKQLRVTLGLWPQPPKSSLNPKVYGLVERGDYTIEKFVLETLPGFYLSGNIYKPAHPQGRLPAILCPHGHWEDGRVNPEVQPRCIRLAKLGFFVVMYDMVGYNDSKYFKHEFLNPHPNRWGYSLPTLQTWNSIRVMDWLCEREDVDPARIGCTGESGGGTQTFLLSALDSRLSIAAPVVMVSENFQGGCVCENAAGLRHGTDNVEIAALTAPRPMKLVGATGDWTVHTNSHTLPVLQQVYRLLGAGDKVEAETFTFPHNYNQTSRNAIYPFLTREFLGYSDPDRSREGEQSLENPANLWTFNTETPAPTDRKSASQLETELTAWLAGEIRKMSPQVDPSGWQVHKPALLDTLKSRLGLRTVTAAEWTSSEIRKVDRGQVRIVHSVIDRESEGGSVATVLLIPPNSTGRLTVVATGRGKAGLIQPDGSFLPLVESLLNAGQIVAGFDPLLVGEQADPGNPRASRPQTVHYEAYNKVLLADQAQDLATVLGWARRQPAIREVNLAAIEGSGPIALLSLPLLEGVARTYVDLEEFDYGDGTQEIPPALDLPGVLQFGGLSAVAAMASPRLLWISRPGNKELTDWAKAAYLQEGSAQSLRVDAQVPAQADIVQWLCTSDWPR